MHGAVAAQVPDPVAPEALGHALAARREGRACRVPQRASRRRGRRARGRRACRACGTCGACGAWACVDPVSPREVAACAALVEVAVGVGGGARGQLLARAVPLRARVSRCTASAGSRHNGSGVLTSCLRGRRRLQSCRGRGDRVCDPFVYHPSGDRHPHEEVESAGQPELTLVELAARIRGGGRGSHDAWPSATAELPRRCGRCRWLRGEASGRCRCLRGRDHHDGVRSDGVRSGQRD